MRKPERKTVQLSGGHGMFSSTTKKVWDGVESQVEGRFSELLPSTT